MPLGEESEPKLYLCQCSLNFTLCQELLCAFDYIPWISFTSHLEILPAPVHSPFSLPLGNTRVESRTTRSCESSFRDIFCPKTTPAEQLSLLWFYSNVHLGKTLEQMTLFVTMLSSYPPLMREIFTGPSQTCKGHVYSCVFREGLQSSVFRWLYLQHGCPLENSVVKENGLENVEEEIKRQLTISWQHKGVDYCNMCWEKIALVANTLCVCINHTKFSV